MSNATKDVLIGAGEALIYIGLVTGIVWAVL